MITQLKVSNYRSLGADTVLTLERGRLTALVGPNGSGKSNIADVFRFVSESLRLGLEAAVTKRHGIKSVRRWSSGRPLNLNIGLTVDSAAFKGGYEFELTGDSAEEYRVKSESAWIHPAETTVPERFVIREGTWIEGPPALRPQVAPRSLALTLIRGDERFRPLADLLTNVAVYAIFPDTLREPQKPDAETPMKQHGENWVSILKSQPSEVWSPELISALGRLTGDIDDIRVRQVGGYLLAEFHHRPAGAAEKSKRQKWFDTAQESDGTLRVAGMISAMLQQPPLTLIGIEEPELTVHVGAIPLLTDYLKQASRSSQVLITTHSIHVLDELDVESIRVVQRVAGITTLAKMSAAQRDQVKQRLLTLGELVQMEGLQPELGLAVAGGSD